MVKAVEVAKADLADLVAHKVVAVAKAVKSAVRVVAAAKAADKVVLVVLADSKVAQVVNEAVDKVDQILRTTQRSRRF